MSASTSSEPAVKTSDKPTEAEQKGVVAAAGALLEAKELEVMSPPHDETRGGLMSTGSVSYIAVSESGWLSPFSARDVNVERELHVAGRSAFQTSANERIDEVSTRILTGDVRYPGQKGR